MPDLCLVSAAGVCQGTVVDLWRSMGWIIRADVVLLAMMLAYVAAIGCNSLYRFAKTRRHSHLFIENAALALRNGDIEKVLAVANSRARGCVARIIGAGLIAFADTPYLSDDEAAGASERAIQRIRSRLVAELKRGAGTLFTIAVCAPLVGFVGTIFGILGAFIFSHGWANFMNGLGETLVTTAFGLFISIPAVWCRHYVLTNVKAFEVEMSNATLETTTFCRTHYQLRSTFERSNVEKTVSISVLEDASGTHPWEIPYDRPRGILLLVSLYTFLFVFLVVLTALVGFLGGH